MGNGGSRYFLRAQDRRFQVGLLRLRLIAFPATLALIPAFKTLDRDAAFDASVEAFIDGVWCQCKATGS
jgi:hypothetical protein